MAAAKAFLRLPATSANLGPGFDTLALALDLALEVEAAPAERYSIAAAGRGVEVCSALQGNLLLQTYEDLWRRHRADTPRPLALSVANGIPLGMGCGSSAASRLAGAGLAAHFGELGWDRGRILNEVAALEHHPDNAAACCLGGFVVSGYAPQAVPEADPRSNAARTVLAVSFASPPEWRALLVLPAQPLATAVSRAALPERYARAAIVHNLQNAALLVAAFAQANGELLHAATGDLLHQPFRAEVCPLLPRLLPLAGSSGILSVTLSGAGAGVLLLLESEAAAFGAKARVLSAAKELPVLPVTEMVLTPLGNVPATLPGIL